ncbi:carboxypeptidase 4 [Diaporthe sp. PMI_573]|nr:carboxypeptidase 4 [Diaporthaceae sp. PMI_573]
MYLFNLALLFGLCGASSHLNKRSEEFVIDRYNFPYVPFDIGESYGGLLPVSSNPNDTQKLYFWFSPSENPVASNEITIWLNGGPGCSSLIGLLQENGNFLWQAGTAQPVANPWAWTKLTNMVWIDQPVGAGFSQGEPTAYGSGDTAVQFLGFWKNFVDTFNLTNRDVYITGESYAGKYIPYIAEAMLDANDTEPGYYNVQGTMLIDPAISPDVALVEIPMLDFVENNQAFLRLNSTFKDEIRAAHQEQYNYTSFFETYFKFPTAGPMPTRPDIDEGSSPFRNYVTEAATLVNPCFNVYHITDTCPSLYDPLDTFDAAGASLGGYFNQTEVQRAMNAPQVSYSTCGPRSVFVDDSATGGPGNGGDLAAPASFGSLPAVFDRVPLNLVLNGALDMLIPSVGTLFALQNVTWRGATGFSAEPTQTFIVPPAAGNASLNGQAGEMGTWGYERGVVFVDVAGAGHELPEYNPSAAFRLLEVLLGRVAVEDGLGEGVDWTTPLG